jgi:hypothetical protein
MKKFTSLGTRSDFCPPSAASPQTSGLTVTDSTPTNTARDDRPIRHLERGNWHAAARLLPRDSATSLTVPSERLARKPPEPPALPRRGRRASVVDPWSRTRRAARTSRAAASHRIPDRSARPRPRPLGPRQVHYPDHRFVVPPQCTSVVYHAPPWRGQPQAGSTLQEAVEPSSSTRCANPDTRANTATLDCALADLRPDRLLVILRADFRSYYQPRLA